MLEGLVHDNKIMRVICFSCDNNLFVVIIICLSLNFDGRTILRIINDRPIPAAFRVASHQRKQNEGSGPQQGYQFNLTA